MNLSHLLLASLAPQVAVDAPKPLPTHVDMPDVKTEWIAPVKPPLTPEELASQNRETVDPPKNELPANLRSARSRIDRSRMYYDLPGDGNLWARGASYKASFGAQGTTYVPAFGPEAPHNFPVSFSVAQVTIDGQPLGFEAVAPAQRDGDVIFYDRGTFTERYDMALESMEQKFVFHELPFAGELAVDVAIDTELQVTQAADGSLVFDSEFGRVGYTSALIVDAHGSRIPIPTETVGQHVELRVPHATLAQCAFPITIDPVISTVSFNSGTDTTYNPDSAYDVSYDRFLVVWEDVYSSSDHDVWGEYWSSAGTYIGSGAWIDFTTDNWVNPHVANNNLENTFLVVAQRGSNNNRRITGRIRYASSSTMGDQFIVDGGGTGERFNPDVGGDPLLVGPTYFCVVFEREFISGSDHDVHAQLVSPTGARIGGTILIDNSASTLDRYPRISQSNGAGPWQTQRWNVVWNRQFSSTDEDVRGAQLDWDGTVVTSSFSVDFSGFDDEWPMVSAPLDDTGTGERAYLAVYERANFSGGVVMGSLLEGNVRISNPNISSLEGVTNRTRLHPAVTTDGRMFMVGSSRRFSTSTTDFDVYVSSFAVNGSNLTRLETSGMAFSTDLEYDVQLCSTYSGGGARRRCMGTWTDANVTNPDFDVEGGIYEGPIPPLGTTYCTAINNSTGQGGQISAIGSPSVSEQEIQLQVTGLPANTPGLFFFGTNAIQVPFGDGFRCVGGQVRRMYPFVHSDSSGIATRSIDWSANYASSLTAGDVYWQLWYRDGAAGLTGFNLSNGLHTVLIP